jgi:uncharacterized protein (TIGR02117 family)
MFRKTLRYLFRFILSFILFIIIYLGFAFLLPHLKLNNNNLPPASGIEIFVQSNGMHTDFVLPVRTNNFRWSELIPFADFKNADSTCHYISIGWGDKGFYVDTPTWNDLKFSTAFKAAFGLSNTAMHISYKHYPPKLDEKCKRLVISKVQYLNLIRYIYSSFQINDKKVLMVEHAGYTDHDRFYEANGTYSMFKTCNVWTGLGLQVMEVKVGVWTPFADGVLGSLE